MGAIGESDLVKEKGKIDAEEENKHVVGRR